MLQLYTDKNTDQMRSTFIAVGLAELLYNIPPANTGQQVTITDQGSCYVITSTLSFNSLSDYVTQRGLPPLLPAISKKLTSKEQSLIAEGKASEQEVMLKYLPRGFGGATVKYDDHKTLFEAYRKYRPPKNGVPEEGAPAEPHPDFPVWAHLCSYFGKGSAMRTGYPGVLHTWHAHQGNNAVALWELICKCYGNFPNAVEEVQDVWHKHLLKALNYEDYPLATSVSALAVVSPSTSKGVSAATGYNRLIEDTPATFWLEMYFAFVGFLEMAMPYTLSKDILTFYPLPHDINIQALHDVMQAHRKSSLARTLYMYSNSVPRAKLDVLGHITFFKNMVEHYIQTYDDGTLLSNMSLNSISGLVGYYYKDISTQIPFDETTFALPPWLPPQPDIETLEVVADLLEQHRILIDSISGRPPKYQMTADEMLLIERYRRYLTQGNVEDWIDFAIACGLYRFRNMGEVRRLPTLTLSMFEESFPMTNHMSDRVDYQPILNNEGFRNVANAIRYCTSYTRYIRDVKNDRTFPYKARHGLGDDLLRNAHNAELFVADLSRFVHDYRRESINVHANTGKTRSEITSDDLNQVTGLIAQYGSRIVAHLLVATGYAASFGNQKNT